MNDQSVVITGSIFTQSQLNNYFFSLGKNRQEVVDHYTCVSGGEFLDVFIPPKPKVLNPKPKGDGKKKEPFGPILAFQLFQVIVNFLAELTFTFIGADSTRVNTGIY